MRWSQEFLAATTIAIFIAAAPASARDAADPFLVLERPMDMPRGMRAMCLADSGPFCGAMNDETPPSSEPKMMVASVDHDYATSALATTHDKGGRFPAPGQTAGTMQPFSHFRLIDDGSQCDGSQQTSWVHALTLASATDGCIGGTQSAFALSSIAPFSAGDSLCRFDASDYRGAQFVSSAAIDRLPISPDLSMLSITDPFTFQHKDAATTFTVAGCGKGKQGQTDETLSDFAARMAQSTQPPMLQDQPKTQSAVLMRYERSAPTPIDGKSAMAQLKAINRYVNGHVVQKTDWQIYNQDELWRRSGTGPYAMGDCEDIALEKRYALIENGFPADRLTFAVVYLPQVGLHTILVARLPGGDFVLDSRSPYIQRWDRTGYSWLSIQDFTEPGKWYSRGTRKTMLVQADSSTNPT